MPQASYWVSTTGLLILLHALPFNPASAQQTLPEIGDSSSSTLSVADERKLGEAFMRELRANVEIIDDPEVTGYIEDLGYKLAASSETGFPGFKFFVIGEPNLNAFAAPGGFIGINSGLIAVTESESELAAVVAHEIAHVTQHHIARAFELSDRSAVPAVAGLIAAILIGIQNPEAGVATAAAVQAKSIQSQIDFTRQNEKEADRVGMGTLLRAGFDPKAMPDFFQRMGDASRYYGQPPEFLSTHPVTASRIADSVGRLANLPPKQYDENLAFHLVRAKLMVTTSTDPKDTLIRVKDILDTGQYVNLLGATYAYLLALTRTNQLAEARQVALYLIEADPNVISFYDALAQVAIAEQNYTEALAIYEDNLELYPNDKLLSRGYVSALIFAGRAERAISFVDAYAKYQSMDAAMYKLSARAYEAANDQKGAHAALAEHFYTLGNLEAALNQLHLAVNTPGEGFYKSSRIEARMEEWQQEQDLRDKRKL